MNQARTLAEHFALLFEDSLKESGCANRRARLPWEVFAQLLRRVLRPLAQALELYAQRWEHELFYRQLKQQLRKGARLQSHTATTAAQEIAALMLAAALLAQERDRAAAGQVPVSRVRFGKLLELMRPL